LPIFLTIDIGPTGVWVMSMTTNGAAANDSVFDDGCEVADVDIGVVGVAAVRTPPAPVPDRVC